MRHYFLCFFTLLFFSHNALAATKTPHDNAEFRCLDCHITLPLERVALSFYSDIPSICLGCHETDACRDETKTVNSYIHPIRIVPTMSVPDDLVLDIQGNISCITCHFYHDKEKAALVVHDHYLRRSTVKRLCLSCHEKI